MPKVQRDTERKKKKKPKISPSTVVVVAGSREVEATEALHGINGVAVCDRAQRELLLGPVVGTKPGTDGGRYEPGRISRSGTVCVRLGCLPVGLEG